MTTPKPRPSIVHGESHSYPVLPLRDIVVFPHIIVPLFVGREKSIRALEEVMKNDALIMLATQKNASDDDPSPDSIYETGTLASVLQLLKLPDGTVKVLVEGLERARVQKYSDRSEYYEATAVALADTDAKSVEAVASAVENRPELGRVDVLVNTAGIASKKHPREKVLDIDPDEFVHLYRVNVAGPLLTLQKFHNLLKKSSHAPRVVNISSVMGAIQNNQFGKVAGYRCSKAGLNARTKTEAFDAKGILFVALHPGWVQTDMGNAGGRKAEITPEESVRGMVSVIERLRPEDSGKFMDYKGELVPF